MSYYKASVHSRRHLLAASGYVAFFSLTNAYGLGNGDEVQHGWRDQFDRVVDHRLDVPPAVMLLII